MTPQAKKWVVAAVIIATTVLVLPLRLVRYVPKKRAPTVIIISDFVPPARDNFNRDDQFALVHFAEVRAELKLTPQQDQQLKNACTIKFIDPGFVHYFPSPWEQWKQYRLIYQWP